MNDADKFEPSAVRQFYSLAILAFLIILLSYTPSALPRQNRLSGIEPMHVIKKGQAKGTSTSP
jgi:hypothetical protein